jgi:2-keto-4-pentenoate hydratase/2-oxohepta-3-ene-1,7-dioic acid hydratase in catechol pathway
VDRARRPRGRARRRDRQGHQGRRTRDIQRSDDQWARAKGFDTSCPIGPWVVPGLDVDDLAVRARVNGELRQDGRTSQLIFDVAYLISYVSEVFTLLPGDVILTGTPAGVGRIEDRDVVECEIEDIGTLRNPVLRRS